jgi:hypothetical protein
LEPDDVSPKALADECKSAASTYYGAAGPEFVRQLTAMSISAKDVRERVDAFVQDALKDSKDYHGQAARVAARFGLTARRSSSCAPCCSATTLSGELTFLASCTGRTTAPKP